VAPVSDRKLVFIGFMGAGKSTAAAAAATALGVDWADSDTEFERRYGPIHRTYAERGEAAFREGEERVIEELLADGPPVLAVGGGAVETPSVAKALGAHVVVWCRIGFGEARRRVDADPPEKRPLAADRDDFRERFERRQPIYERLADAVLPPADPELAARAAPALAALRELPGARLAWATSASGEYPAIVARGLLSSGYWPLESRRFRITDETVAGLYPEAGAPLAASVAVAPGEGAKTMAEAERVLRELATAGMTRSDHVAAVGGGVVGDLGGFCAALYQRGVDVVQVPTTLVAQVDSAYGGKTGVDLPEAKNYAGAYHQPAAVLTDPDVLATLPKAELAAGFAEVVKTALIAGGELWEQVRSLETLDPKALDDVVFACARTKLEVVAADERDAGRRQSLNLGHTVGHAIEQATGYGRYRHGEAVGLGLLAALDVSEAAELRGEVEQLLARHGLPTELDGSIEINQALDAVGRDKKVTAHGLGFVLCPRPGEVLTGQQVDPAALRAAVERLA
jgi:shikimate kinase/3-dehydroquinate synthase